MKEGWLRIALGSCRFSFPNSPECRISGSAREGRWVCTLTDGLVLAVELRSTESGVRQEELVSPAKGRLMLSWGRESAVKGTIDGSVMILDRLQGGAFERFNTTDELRQREYYRCVDSHGKYYELCCSYPLELGRDQAVRNVVASFWRMITWIDESSITSFSS